MVYARTGRKRQGSKACKGNRVCVYMNVYVCELPEDLTVSVYNSKRWPW
jgi:hypothetical protein